MLNKSHFSIRWIIKVDDILCFEVGFEIRKFTRCKMPVVSSLRISPRNTYYGPLGNATLKPRLYL
jgi:hypothetical protein